WLTLADYLRAPLVKDDAHPLLDLAFTLALIGLALASWRVVRPSYALFASLFLLALLSHGTLLSLPRFALELFPLFAVLAVAGRLPAFHQVYLAVSLGVAAMFMAMFGLGYWVA